MDFTAILSKQIESENPAPDPQQTPAEDVREMIESAAAQVRAEMQAQIDTAKARADELEKRLLELSEPRPADPGTDKQED